MKVLIIGSKGFIGSHLLSFLTKKGIDSAGISSSDCNAIDPKTGILSGEFSIPSGTGTIIYLSQSPFYHQLPEMASHLMSVNVLSAMKVADLARRAMVRRFIYASSGNVYAPSFEPLCEDSPLCRNNWYSLSKVHAEEILSLYRNDIEVIVVRPFGIYGPGQTNKLVSKLLNSVLQNRIIPIERNPHNFDDIDGLKISLCYIDDIVEILYRLSINGGPAYLNIAGDEVFSIRQITNLISGYLKKEPIYEIVEDNRKCNLIADISLLKKILNPVFTEIHDGISRTIKSEVKNYR